MALGHPTFDSLQLTPAAAAAAASHTRHKQIRIHICMIVIMMICLCVWLLVSWIRKQETKVSNNNNNTLTLKLIYSNWSLCSLFLCVSLCVYCVCETYRFPVILTSTTMAEKRRNHQSSSLCSQLYAVAIMISKRNVRLCTATTSPTPPPKQFLMEYIVLVGCERPFADHYCLPFG